MKSGDEARSKGVRGSHRLVRDPLAVYEVLVPARLVVLVLDLPLANGDVGEASAAHGHPPARGVVAHHHLGAHADHRVPAERGEEEDGIGPCWYTVIKNLISVLKAKMQF